MIATLLVFYLATAVSTEHRFGYSVWDQRKWRQTYVSCGGSLQSPIKIDSQRAIPLRMPAVETIRYHDLLPEPLKLINNGHSVSLSIPKFEDGEEKQHRTFTPYVFGARMANDYEFESLHFHWGDKNNLGSEHIFNDVRYPMEMHLIHRNKKYNTIEEAIAHRDGLAVLAFFYQLREKENKQLSRLVRVLPLIEKYNSSLMLNYTFTLSSLLPPSEEMDEFYTYLGSLTTPPCSEVVTWIIFPNPLPVSVRQMVRFRKLRTGDEKSNALLYNYRDVQKLGSRRVFVRKLRPRGTKYNSTMHYSKWEWFI